MMNSMDYKDVMKNFQKVFKKITLYEIHRVFKPYFKGGLRGSRLFLKVLMFFFIYFHFSTIVASEKEITYNSPSSSNSTQSNEQYQTLKKIYGSVQIFNISKKELPFNISHFSLALLIVKVIALSFFSISSWRNLKLKQYDNFFGQIFSSFCDIYLWVLSLPDLHIQIANLKCTQTNWKFHINQIPLECYGVEASGYATFNLVVFVAIVIFVLFFVRNRHFFRPVYKSFGYKLNNFEGYFFIFIYLTHIQYMIFPDNSLILVRAIIMGFRLVFLFYVFYLFCYDPPFINQSYTWYLCVICGMDLSFTIEGFIDLILFRVDIKSPWSKFYLSTTILILLYIVILKVMDHQDYFLINQILKYREISDMKFQNVLQAYYAIQSIIELPPCKKKEQGIILIYGIIKSHRNLCEIDDCMCHDINLNFSDISSSYKNFQTLLLESFLRKNKIKIYPRLFIASHYLDQMGNIPKSAMNLSYAKDMLDQDFLLAMKYYLIKAKLKKTVMKQSTIVSFDYQEPLKVNLYFKMEKLSIFLENLISNNSELAIEFWKTFFDEKLKMKQLLDIASRFREINQEIREKYNSLELIRLKFNLPYIVHIKKMIGYLIVITNDEIEGTSLREIYEKVSLVIVNSTKRFTDRNLENLKITNQSIFHKECVFISIAIGDKHNKVGIILKASRNCSSVLGYQSQELIGKNINVIIPHPFKNHHDSYVQSAIDNRKNSGLLLNERTLFAVHHQGYLRKIFLTVRVHFDKDLDCLVYLGIILPYFSEKEYIVTNHEGLVHGMTKNLCFINQQKNFQDTRDPVYISDFCDELDDIFTIIKKRQFATYKNSSTFINSTGSEDKLYQDITTPEGVEITFRFKSKSFATKNSKKSYEVELSTITTLDIEKFKGFHLYVFKLNILSTTLNGKRFNDSKGKLRRLSLFLTKMVNYNDKEDDKQSIEFPDEKIVTDIEKRVMKTDLVGSRKGNRRSSLALTPYTYKEDEEEEKNLLYQSDNSNRKGYISIITPTEKLEFAHKDFDLEKEASRSENRLILIDSVDLNRKNNEFRFNSLISENKVEDELDLISNNPLRYLDSPAVSSKKNQNFDRLKSEMKNFPFADIDDSESRSNETNGVDEFVNSQCSASSVVRRMDTVKTIDRLLKKSQLHGKLEDYRKISSLMLFFFFITILTTTILDYELISNDTLKPTYLKYISSFILGCFKYGNYNQHIYGYSKNYWNQTTFDNILGSSLPYFPEIQNRAKLNLNEIKTNKENLIKSISIKGKSLDYFPYKKFEFKFVSNEKYTGEKSNFYLLSFISYIQNYQSIIATSSYEILISQEISSSLNEITYNLYNHPEKKLLRLLNVFRDLFSDNIDEFMKIFTIILSISLLIILLFALSMFILNENMFDSVREIGSIISSIDKSVPEEQYKKIHSFVKLQKGKHDLSDKSNTVDFFPKSAKTSKRQSQEVNYKGIKNNYLLVKALIMVTLPPILYRSLIYYYQSSVLNSHSSNANQIYHIIQRNSDIQLLSGSLYATISSSGLIDINGESIATKTENKFQEFKSYSDFWSTINSKNEWRDRLESSDFCKYLPNLQKYCDSLGEKSKNGISRLMNYQILFYQEILNSYEASDKTEQSKKTIFQSLDFKEQEIARIVLSSALKKLEEGAQIFMDETFQAFIEIQYSVSVAFTIVYLIFLVSVLISYYNVLKNKYMSSKRILLMVPNVILLKNPLFKRYLIILLEYEKKSNLSFLKY